MMLEQLRYKNHMNEVFDFGASGIYVNENDLHDYAWNVTQKNGRITSLLRNTVTRQLPVIIICDSESSGTAAKNRMMEVMEKDVLAMQHGRIMIGDYYFRCFVTKSTKKNYLINKRYMTVTLTLTSDFPYWVKETTHIFRKLGADGSGGTNKDFPYDFPYDYFSGIGSKDLNNTDFVSTNFRMVIYGPCVDPVVYISGHKYSVNYTLDAGEYLTIDSINKTVTLTAIDGTQTNLFAYRGRDEYVFEKIPAGQNAVVWEGDFGIDVILLEERSEPKWT